jgi:hypothetical protein
VLLALCSAIVGAACVVASGRRLAWAIAPMGLDPRLVREALEGQGGVAVLGGLRRELADGRAGDRLAWDRELLAALDEPDGPSRDARVNEQLIEIEGRTDRWSRVPRVCASIGTSAALLLASIALVQAGGGDDAAGPVAIGGALNSALGALSLGIAATSFCLAVHVRAARVSRERRAAIDQLVERLVRVQSMSDGKRQGA